MKFWGLLAMVAPTAHITQQNFLIGSIPRIEFFIGQDKVTNISVPILSLSMRFSPYMPLTHIYMSHISHFCGRIFKHTIFKIVYNEKATHKNITCSHLLGIMSQLNGFHPIPSQIFTTYNWQSIFQESISLLP